jgi:two-component system response regulator MtrA
MARPATAGFLDSNGRGERRPRGWSAEALGRIAVVHTIRTAGSGIVERLSAQPFDVLAVPVGRSMIDDLLERAPDVVVVDHRRSEFDVVRVCRDVSESMNSRIIVVSDTAADEGRVITALNAGADDFLDQQTSTPLLVAHVRVALRSRSVAQRKQERLAIGDVLIDLDAHVVSVAGVPMKCPPRQFALLTTLAREANMAVRRESLLADVWGADPATADPRRLRIAISLLRGVLGSGPNRPRIETVSQVGYRLVVASDEGGGTGAAEATATTAG